MQKTFARQRFFVNVVEIVIISDLISSSYGGRGQGSYGGRRLVFHGRRGQTKTDQWSMTRGIFNFVLIVYILRLSNFILLCPINNC